MDALKDIWASLISGVRERTTNPLSFAFLVSWSVWNFKIFVVLFGNGSTTEKLKDIESLYPANSTTYIGGALLLPLLTAAAYVFVYPYISAMAIKFYRMKQVEIANTVKGVEEKRLLTAEEATVLTRRHEAERQSRIDKEKELNAAVQSLRDALLVAEKEASKKMEDVIAPENAARLVPPAKFESKNIRTDAMSESVRGLLQAMNPVQVKLLIDISSTAGGIFPNIWADENGRNFTLVKNDVAKLQGLGLVEGRGNGSWTLTPLGENVAIQLLPSESE